MRAAASHVRFVRLLTGLFVAAGFALSVSGCQEAFSGPSIDSATITPSEVPEADTGMTDECFTVDMTISGFESEITEVEIFLVDNPGRSATAIPGSPGACSANESPKFESTGASVTVGGIIKSTLVQGLDPNSYQIGAEITQADGGTVTQRGIATIRIVES